MFLRMLSSEGRETFIKLALLFSVSDNQIDPDARHDEKIHKSKDEEIILDGLRAECDIEEGDYEYIREEQEQEFLDSFDALPKSSINSSLFRKEICSGFLKDLVKNKKGSLSASDRKIFIFEMMALGLADGQISEIEQHLLNVLAEEIKVDRDTCDELLEHCKQINHEVRKALSLIME